jgi:hypothetical protein
MQSSPFAVEGVGRSVFAAQFCKTITGRRVSTLT